MSNWKSQQHILRTATLATNLSLYGHFMPMQAMQETVRKGIHVMFAISDARAVGTLASLDVLPRPSSFSIHPIKDGVSCGHWVASSAESGN